MNALRPSLLIASVNQRSTDPAVRFLAFFLAWAELMRWKVPDIHIRAAVWLATFGQLGVLRCFRGFGKSTMLGIYNAWRYYEDHQYRILHQGDQDGTAYKTSRDTKRVLSRHPWTRKLSDIRGESSFWWVPGADDERNPSMQAAGIMSNITSSRADEIQNDDVEVPRNIRTPEARETLRYRLGEQTHILVPGGRKLFIGTPHTHDSIYDEMARLGADCLTIRMFDKEFRIDAATKKDYSIPFKPEYVFSGIGEKARLLKAGKDYKLTRGGISFSVPPQTLLDCYSGCAWPERFTIEELEKRRRETRTANEWDSQYQLHSKPVSEVRLDPARIIPYDLQPIIRRANNEVGMWLGSTRIVGAIAYWDCSLGKVKSDASAFTLMLTDERGNLYWHKAQGLTGDLDAQCESIKDLVTAYQIPRVVVETNGPGGFVPPILRKHLSGTGCGVAEEFSTANKQSRILDAFEPAISSRFLWAHVDVLEGPVWDQMKDFNPSLKDQPDDYIDSGAGAIKQTPVRIGKIVGKQTHQHKDDWRPSSGVHEVTLEF